MIQSGDHKGRTCVARWIKLNSSGDDVEVSHEDGVIVIEVKKYAIIILICLFVYLDVGHWCRGGCQCV